MPRPPPPSAPHGSLTGWKAIAAHLGRNQSTVRRWAAEAGLPVYRPQSGVARKGATVYALRAELDAWITRFGTAAPVAATSPAADPRPGSQPGPHNPLIRAPIAADAPAEAHRLYLEGAYLWPKRTAQALTAAEARLRRATALAPGLAAAHAELAVVCNLMGDYDVVPVQVGYRLAAAAARQALAIEATNARAHCVLADIRFYGERDFDGSLALFRLATECDPEDPLCRHWYGAALAMSGRHDAARQQLQMARMLFPTSPLVIYAETMNTLGLGEFDAARHLLVDLVGGEPGFSNPLRLLAFAELGRADVPAWLAAWDEHFRLRGEAATCDTLDAARGRMGNSDLASVVRFLRDSPALREDQGLQHGPQGGDLYFRAHLAALAGDWQLAADLLARVPDCTAFYNIIDPAFAAARLDPGFRTNLRRAQLPAD